MVTLLASSYLYYLFIGDAYLYSLDNLWSRPANIHDHKIYYNYINYRSAFEFRLFDNNYGISFIYNLLPGRDIQQVSFAVNCFFLGIYGILYVKICEKLDLPIQSFLLIMLNTSVLYFSLLINKDMITLAIVVAALYFGLCRKWTYVLLLIIPAFLIRQQLVYFIASFMALSILTQKSLKFNTIALFSVTSVLGILVLRAESFISLDTLGEGFTGQITRYFYQNPILAPFGVPLRIALYQWEFFGSVFIYENGQIDAAKFLRAPAAIYLLLQIPIAFGAYVKGRAHWDGNLKITYYCLISIFAAILLNPQINGRYYTVLVPVLFVFIALLKRTSKKADNQDPGLARR